MNPAPTTTGRGENPLSASGCANCARTGIANDSSATPEKKRAARRLPFLLCGVIRWRPDACGFGPRIQ